MPRLRSAILLTLAFTLAITGCKKTYTYPAIPLTSYFAPLQVGKYVTYRLDSLNFYYYGQLDTMTSYLAKDSVEAAITDNLGNASWRVVRYLSDTTGSSWTPSETYLVTPSVKTIEVVENNLRFIKLAFPLEEGYSWTGNTYMPYAPYQSFFDFSDDSHLNVQLWNYTYQNVNQGLVLGNTTYDSTITVVQVNDSINVPILDPNSFASRTYWTETYAKNIGMIFRHTELWEYQPPTPNGTQSGYKIGFELTLSLVDHN